MQGCKLDEKKNRENESYGRYSVWIMSCFVKLSSNSIKVTINQRFAWVYSVTNHSHVLKVGQFS